MQLEEGAVPTPYVYNGATAVTGTPYKFSTISNYVETIKTNVDLNPKGLQTLALKLDGAGVPTAYTDTVLKHNPSQQIVFPLSPAPVTYTTTKDITAISGGAASLTITHSDLTTTVIP
jgi:hypothetical protein